MTKQPEINEPTPGAGKTVKLADVARAAGVSQGTVSNVFNRPELVSPSLREKVEATAATLGYRGPDPRGRLLRAGRVNAVGVVTSAPLHHFFEDPYTRIFLAEISRSCQARGAGISLVSALDDEIAAWNIRTALVDGFILNCLVEGSRLVDLARRRGLPFVAIDFRSDPDVDYICIDDEWGAREAARHLVSLGHKRFGILMIPASDGPHAGFLDVSGEDPVRFDLVRRRLGGYLAAISEAGLPLPRAFETQADEASVSAGVDALLADDPTITAFLCMSDRIALHACHRLASIGARVPEDYSVVGFDGTREAATFNPPITTIRQPVGEKGAAAVDLVLGDPAAITERQLILPLSLVVGGSSGPPRG
ncbi:LacI family DNA-binding transcriptional regulator [Oryzibacter oryziterrae]|uniref:LacI family DNA-binding transcriptional regulator n=1 Tax=Oryzibacter oryziterrae TaxID=2766474 RepID=UPI001F47878E|nr:LacI family DNA-binding transcriptional regulator [Oryzibacter oryziterrae]